MNFQINEKVKIADSDGIGTVADKMHSEKTGKTLYRILLEDDTDGYFEENELAPAGGAVDLSLFAFEITLDNNIAIVRARYNGREIAHNHGHIFNDGIAGAVQAVSYAFRRMWQSLEEQEEENEKEETQSH